MRRGFLFTLLIGILAMFQHVNAQTTLFCGPEGSATYQMAEDIKKHCKIEISIQPTEKLVESFRNLKPGQVCFIQYDILQNELLNDLKNGTSNAEKAELLLPLGYEEIHLITLGSSMIRDFKDLKAGSKIGVGANGTTMRQTVEVVKNLTKQQWTDVEISGRDAVKALLNKEIDAMFFVGNAPDDQLKVFSQLAGANDLLRLVPISEKSLNGSYSFTTIRSSTYKWANYNVDTYAAKSVLVATTVEDQKAPELAQLRKFLSAIQSNIKVLQRAGHVNWRSVNFVFDGLNWNKHLAAKLIFDPKKAAPKEDTKKKEGTK